MALRGPEGCDLKQLQSVLRATNDFLASLLKDLETPNSPVEMYKQYLKWPLSKDKVKSHLVMLERVKTWLLLVITADNTACAQSMYEKIGDLAISVKETLQLQNHEDHLRWLAPVDPADLHWRVLRNPDIRKSTGRWFINGVLKDLIEGEEVKSEIIFLRGKCTDVLKPWIVRSLLTTSDCQLELERQHCCTWAHL